MQIYLKEISFIFDQLINERMTREETANWATDIMRAEDRGELEYYPPLEEKKIWDAILYLVGVDLMQSPSCYLLSMNDLIAFRNELGI